MRRFVKVLATMAVVAVLAVAHPAKGWAQSGETLADIRQELSVVYVELQKLKRELSTTGNTGQVSVGGSVLERVGAMESELQRLTSKTEELEHKIDRVVTDGTNRVGDLEFRLCEIDTACDIATLEAGSTLGGVEVSTGASGGQVIGSGDTGNTDNSGGMELAVGEEADFKAAEAAMEAGDFANAAAMFGKFQSDYPGGPLTAQAGLLRGKSLEQAGDLKEAGRAYLKLFSDDEQGPMAAVALRNLGSILGRLGQTQQACVTLGEVGVRFPQSSEVLEAQSTMANLGCQ